MKGLVAVLVVSAAAVAAAQSGFVPGSSLSPERYAELKKSTSEANDAVQQASRKEGSTPALGASLRERLEALNAEVDKETRPAMAEVFANPTAVYFHQFTPSGARPNTKDGADGLRVVWEREIEVAGKTGPEKRLLSVITFWEFDPATGGVKMRTGDDSIRVRVELRGDDSVWLGDRFAGLSYSTKTDERGNIVSIEPGIYLDENGETKAGAAHQAMTSECSSCHSSGRRKNFHPGLLDPKNGNFKSFVEDAKKNGATPAAVAALEALAANPKAGFLPPGIRDALAGKPAGNAAADANAASNLVVIVGEGLRPLHHWNGDRADATKPASAPAAPRAGTAQGAGMKRD